MKLKEDCYYWIKDKYEDYYVALYNLNQDLFYTINGNVYSKYNCTIISEIKKPE